MAKEQRKWPGWRETDPISKVILISSGMYVVAYIIGSVLALVPGLDDEALLFPLAKIPYFQSFHEKIIQELGAVEGKRFATISLCIMVVFVATVLTFALLPLPKLSETVHDRWTDTANFLYVSALLLIFVSLAIWVFFDPEFSMNMTGRRAARIYRSDLKYLLLVALLFLPALVPLLVRKGIYLLKTHLSR